MDNSFNNIKKIVLCGTCGLVLVTSNNLYFCNNRDCPEYLLEKHEHVPEYQNYVSNFRTQMITLSGTAASGATGTYGPINFIEWQKGGETDV